MNGAHSRGMGNTDKEKLLYGAVSSNTSNIFIVHRSGIFCVGVDVVLIDLLLYQAGFSVLGYIRDCELARTG